MNENVNHPWDKVCTKDGSHSHYISDYPIVSSLYYKLTGYNRCLISAFYVGHFPTVQFRFRLCTLQSYVASLKF